MTNVDDEKQITAPLDNIDEYQLKQINAESSEIERKEEEIKA